MNMHVGKMSDAALRPMAAPTSQQSQIVLESEWGTRRESLLPLFSTAYEWEIARHFCGFLKQDYNGRRHIYVA